ncbi:MAG TPA: mechanosensitive ion channel domain-containing protein [Isosphaeraceae bacterium]|jgi:potassium efflux system protein|nr:mechanosensitive ion channel domain-containing protein [Isosphaeraceae bacterium]
MRVIRTVLLGIVSAAVWPLYLLIASTALRLSPCPKPMSKPLWIVLEMLALALWLGTLARIIFRPGGWAETALRTPAPVARQLLRLFVGLIAASVMFVLPEMLLVQGHIAPAGRPITVNALARLLGMGFEVSTWLIVYRLVRSKSPLVIWLLEHPEQFGWLCRNRRPLAWTILGAIGAVIGLDMQGYSFTARRLATAGTQSVVLLGACWAVHALILRAIDSHSWHWMRASTPPPPGATDHPETLDHPRDLPKRLRHITTVVVPVVGVLISAWIWNIDLDLFRSIGEIAVIPSGTKPPITVGDLVQATVILLLTIGAWKHMSTFFALVLYPRMPEDPGIRFAAVTLSRYAALALGVLSGLSAIHLGLEQIGMVLAALGVGLGFGLQEIVSNFVSGIILLIERPIRVGDIVTVAGMSGKIECINIRATTITNAENQSIIVPNREFITGNLVNWTHKDRIIRVSIPLRVAYGTNPDRVADLLITIAREDADVLRNPVPSASLESFGETALNFVLNVHVPDPSLAGRVRHRLAGLIQSRFRDEGIAIPLPSRELHVRSVPSDLMSPPFKAHEPARIDPPSPTPPPPRLSVQPILAQGVEHVNRCVDE